MTTEKGQDLPLFQPFATAQGLLTEQEMDRLIADHAPLLSEGRLGFGNTNPAIRRSKTVFLGAEEKYAWLYDRLWAAAQECNRRFFCVDIAGVETNVQLARYDDADRGFYTWHTDFAGIRPLRKLSISIQLSSSDDYEGGDLELMYGTEPQKLDRSRGTFIIFPSFMLHRVAPVTRGARWSLVAWVLGPRWR
ncbi:MAG TPA: 2OG-Fe(II) oxygenase [Gammaproteobacteria bacterium]|nr:2OG-Fe(II) oxygenase [Gammaproteobacteria bacterium]